ncbi:unnamed protein product, partial [Allacma fusca]|jgi:solute carrier family 32 (vesicular inhibitory amino acid transporter)
MNVC